MPSKYGQTPSTLLSHHRSLWNIHYYWQNRIGLFETSATLTSVTFDIGQIRLYSNFQKSGRVVNFYFQNTIFNGKRIFTRVKQNWRSKGLNFGWMGWTFPKRMMVFSYISENEILLFNNAQNECVGINYESQPCVWNILCMIYAFEISK